MADEEVKEEATTSEEQSTQEAAPAAEESKAESASEQASADKETSKEEAKSASEQASADKPKKEVSGNLESIIEKIEQLSVLELADLVHALEDRFGVTAAAPMAVAAAPAAGGGAAEPAEEQTSFNVILANAGANKIGVIKAVRELVPTLGLKEAKDLVEAAPKPVLEGVNKETANEAKTKLTAAGATVELQ